MKSRIVRVLMLLFVLAACDKKEPAGPTTGGSVPVESPVDCGKEIIAEVPVKVGETGLILPTGTRMCISKDQLEMRIELPDGFGFLTKNETEKTLPVFATYQCNCSQSGSNCQVFYAEGLGFGCLQSSCSGSCTGRFTYKGYSIDRVVVTMEKEKFFDLPEVHEALAQVSNVEPYRRITLYGFTFFAVNNDKEFLAKASCDCEGTQACKLRTVTLPLLKAVETKIKIYFCEGSCNSCELTVN